MIYLYMIIRDCFTHKCLSNNNRRAHHGVDPDGPLKCGGPYGGFATEGDFYRSVRVKTEMTQAVRMHPFPASLLAVELRSLSFPMPHRSMYRTNRNNPFFLLVAGLFAIPFVAAATSIANG